MPVSAEIVLLREGGDGVTALAFNRSKSGNGLPLELVNSLQAAWNDIDGDATTRVVG